MLRSKYFRPNSSFVEATNNSLSSFNIAMSLYFSTTDTTRLNYDETFSPGDGDFLETDADAHAGGREEDDSG